jgi:hypothetical protein
VLPGLRKMLPESDALFIRRREPDVMPDDFAKIYRQALMKDA